jgi:hypothetical protein
MAYSRRRSSKRRLSRRRSSKRHMHRRRHTRRVRNQRGRGVGQSRPMDPFANTQDAHILISKNLKDIDTRADEYPRMMSRRDVYNQIQDNIAEDLGLGEGHLNIWKLGATEEEKDEILFNYLKELEGQNRDEEQEIQYQNNLENLKYLKNKFKYK